MKELNKRLVALFLVIVMCLTGMPIAVFATESDQTEGLWRGDDLAVDITEGTDGYTYMALFRKPAHGYEFSGHFMGDGEGPQTFVLIDTVAHANTTWTPSGRYVNGQSNYEVVYCCDVETMIVDATYYKRLNLEDSEYYSDEQAAKLRAIVTNSYPYVTLDEMKAELAKVGFEGVEELKTGEVIAAVQTAIWACANSEGVPMRYAKSYKVSDNLNWGWPLHDISELSGLDVSGKRVFKTYEDVGQRIDDLVDYLLGLESVHADENTAVVTDLEILESTPVISKDGTYTVLLKVELNNSGRAGDDLSIDITVDSEHVATKKVVSGTTDYTFAIEAKAGQTVKATMSGEQNLNKGVYFYAPRPADTDGDGIATSREVSQNLIGVATGKTPVHCEKEVTIPETEDVTTNLRLNKVDHKGKPLTGAEFTLYVEGKNNLMKIGTYAVDENGELLIENLLPGNYVLDETKVPFGFVPPKGVIKFSVDENGYITLSEGENAEIVDGDSYDVTVEKDSSVTEGEDLPEIEIDIVPGTTTGAQVSEKIGDDREFILIVRQAEVTVSDVDVTVNKESTEIVSSPQPALKFDRNDTADQKQQKLDREIYADNGHFTDHSTISVTGAPNGFPFKYIGNGDYSGHYVSHIRVLYERDEAGNAIKDENGNYVIKELQHASSGAVLHYNGVPTTDARGPFHFATGTRPQQFLLKNEAGDTVYVYCVDVETGAEKGVWYSMANLEDVDYFTSKEAANHIRNIVKYGYWGTAEGMGSLDSLKAALKTAVANGIVDKEYDVNFVNRKKFTAGYELKEGEYHYGNYVYWNVVPQNGEDHVVLSADVIDGLTEGEALDAMQMAIWTYSNGAQATLNGKDGVIIGDLYAGSSQLSDSLNAVNDWAGAARTRALYEYLIGLNEKQESSVVINDKTFAENMSLSVGKYLGNGTYEATLKFTIGNGMTVNAEKDDLAIVLTYVNADGETVTVRKSFAGEDALVADENGYYCVSGLEITAGKAFNFSINISGVQYLEMGAYLFTAQGGISASQTMVGAAEGRNTVDITKTVSITLNVEESKHYEKVYTKTNQTLIVENAPETISISGNKTWNDANNQDGKRPESITVNLLANGIVVDSVTVTEKDGWKYEFNNIDKYENGKEITYTVAEVAVDGYTTVYDGYNVINNYTPSKIGVSVNKIWDDANNQDGKRPTSVTVKLFADGVDTGISVVLSEENHWCATFEGLDEYKAGKKIAYSVEEEAVAGYTPSVNGTSEDGFIITNSYVPEITSVSGNKTWIDANDKDGKRPESITVNLLANGKVVDTVTVTEENGWKFAFENLPKYENGVEIVYSITENAVEGYTTTYDGFNVINTHVASTSVIFGGTKYLDLEEAEGFEFVLVDKDGNVIESVVSLENGRFEFAAIVFEEEGTYRYVIREVVGDNEDILYDVSVYAITVTVTKDAEELKASYTVLKNEEDYEGDIEFFNDTLFEIPEEDPPHDDIPDTGDNTVVYMLVIAVSFVVFNVLLKSRRRKVD